MYQRITHTDTHPSNQCLVKIRRFDTRATLLDAQHSYFLDSVLKPSSSILKTGTIEMFNLDLNYRFTSECLEKEAFAKLLVKKEPGPDGINYQLAVVQIPHHCFCQLTKRLDV